MGWGFGAWTWTWVVAVDFDLVVVGSGGARSDIGEVVWLVVYRPVGLDVGLEGRGCISSVGSRGVVRRRGGILWVLVVVVV